jgi:hypothetical protein
MNERKPQRRTRDEDVGDQEWRHDPNDVRRHAERVRRRERASPLGKVFRYFVAAVALAAVVAIVWNFETLRGVTVDFSAFTSLFADNTTVDDSGARRVGGEQETVVVEAAGVVGDAVPSSVGGPPRDIETVADAPEASLASDPVPAESAAADRLADARPALPAPVPAPPPEPPAEPERVEFGLSVMNVSEAEENATVVILRSGGNRRPSSVTWWTSEGTATPRIDYADLGTRVVQFAAGEQNRTIQIPIVGDRIVEGPENFFVNLTAGQSAGPITSPAQRLEIVINDDD